MAAIASFLIPAITPLQLLKAEMPLGAQRPQREMSLGPATGFFVKRNDQWFVVSNWHVFSGRRTDSGQPKRSDGAVPNFCKLSFLEPVGEKVRNKTFTFSLGELADGDARWYEHPTLGQEADVAALPLADLIPTIPRDLLSPDGHDDTMWIDVGGELFLPGYPLGLSGPAATPIWKRASLATSTEFGEGIDRYVLVDTASREGMSGAPCIALANWQYYSLDRSTGKVTVKNRPMSYRLIGVYSGRLNAKDDLGAQLGIVWRENLILETIDGKKTAALKLA